MAKKEFTPKTTEAPKVKTHGKPFRNYEIQPFLLVAITTIIGTLLAILDGSAFFIAPAVSILSHDIVSAIFDPSYSLILSPQYVGWVGTVIVIVLDLIIAGIYLLMHVFSEKKKRWAVIVGSGLYLFDTLLLLVLYRDFFFILGHGFVLYSLFGYAKPILKSKNNVKAADNEENAPKKGDNPVKNLA